MDTQEEIGERIRAVRKSMGMSMRAAREALNVGLQTLVRYEKGTTSPPAKFLQALLELNPKINPTWLLVGEGDMDGGLRAVEGQLSALLNQFTSSNKDDPVTYFGEAANITLKTGRLAHSSGENRIAGILNEAGSAILLMHGLINGVSTDLGVQQDKISQVWRMVLLISRDISDVHRHIEQGDLEIPQPQHAPAKLKDSKKRTTTKRTGRKK